MKNSLPALFLSAIKNYNRRTWWQDRIANRVVGPIWSRLRYDDGIKVMEQDWDILIVLDACRADLFEDVITEGMFDNYKRVWSLGSNTREWVAKNFTGGPKTNCIYITGNPVVSRHIGTAFHCFLEPWREAFDSELGTVPPEPITETVIETKKQFPNKRIIAHYLQPHYPFILNPELRYSEFDGTHELHVEGTNPGASDIWEAVGLGFEDINNVWRAYENNLSKVLEAIKPLFDQPGKKVVTSDHGNMIGESIPYFPMKLYGHGFGIYHPSLREVPWAVVDSELSTDGDHSIDENIEEKLRSLGYSS